MRAELPASMASSTCKAGSRGKQRTRVCTESVVFSPRVPTE